MRKTTKNSITKTLYIKKVFTDTMKTFCGREGIRTPDPLGVNQVL